MKPCDHSKNIQPIPNPDTGRQGSKDLLHPSACEKGRAWLNWDLLSIKVEHRLPFREDDPKNLVKESLEHTTLTEFSHNLFGNPAISLNPDYGTPFTTIPSHQDRRAYHGRKWASRKFEIDPEKLRPLVWGIPTSQFACLSGVLVKGIEKNYCAFGIPNPPRGDWAKHEQGFTLQEEGK